MKNTHAILLLGFLVGIATNLGLIGAQSFLLSRADAVYTVYGAVISGLLFSLFLKRFQFVRMKFARFAAVCLTGYAVVLAVLALSPVQGVTRAALWFLASYFGFDLLRWIVGELARRHLPPATANASFSYMSAALEGGTLFIIVTGKLSTTVLSPEQTMAVVSLFCLLSLVLVLAHFLPLRNLEIRYTRGETRVPQTPPPFLKNLFPPLLAMAVGYAVVEVSVDYLLKIVLKDALQSYDAIRQMTENYFLASCLLTIVLSNVTGWLIQYKRVSPLTLLRAELFLLLAMGLACLAFPALSFFVAFETARLVAESCLYGPANQMLLFAVPQPYRLKLKTAQNLVFYLIVPLALGALFSFINDVPVAQQSLALLALVLTALSGVLLILIPFARRYLKAMYELAGSDDKAASVIAANLLSYLRPADFVPRMHEFLRKEPKKLLRKTIILGLGYARGEEPITAIVKEFQSDKEEVQMAALDALSVSKRFRAAKFLIDILDNKVKPKTQRVKLNAMAVIGGMYGRHAIPFLLNGLESDEPRVVANALEVLAFFRERELIPYFLKYAESPTARIRANALMGLARFRSTRSRYVATAKQMLESGDAGLKASVLYVIGKLRDRTFKSLVLEIREHGVRADRERLANPVAWALIRTGENAGFDLAGEIMSAPLNERELTNFMHYFSQHTPEDRFELVRHFVASHHGDREAVLAFGQKLKESTFDFHEELEYLNLCLDSFTK